MPTTLGSGTEPGERDERAGQIVVVLADVCGHPHQKLGTSVMAVIPWLASSAAHSLDRWYNGRLAGAVAI